MPRHLLARLCLPNSGNYSARSRRGHRPVSLSWRSWWHQKWHYRTTPRECPCSTYCRHRSRICGARRRGCSVWQPTSARPSSPTWGCPRQSTHSSSAGWSGPAWSNSATGRLDGRLIWGVRSRQGRQCGLLTPHHRCPPGQPTTGGRHTDARTPIYARGPCLIAGSGRLTDNRPPTQDLGVQEGRFYFLPPAAHPALDARHSCATRSYA